MNITFSEIIVWVVVGLLAGSLAGSILTVSKKGYGKFKNLMIGLAGAVLGGLLFKLFRIDLGIGSISITAEDLLSAFIGSLLLIFAFRLVKKKRAARPE